ncbi:MAG: procyclic acidic repetitive family protein [Bacteroidia bacterium]|nr:procyclic acidic repetitive family protein [Bacteroidia bacterium]
MLGIILSPTHLIAGTVQHGTVEFLSWGQHQPSPLAVTDPESELINRIGDLLQEARSAHWFQGSKESPCQILVANSLHADGSELRNSLIKSMQKMGVEDFMVSQVDHLTWSFLNGGGSKMEQGDKFVVINGLGKTAEWIEVERRKGVFGPSAQEVGSESLFKDQKIAARKLANFGPEFGREKVLSHLMKQFSQAGLTLDVATQTELATQLIGEELPERYQISRHTGNVTIEAEATFSREELSILMLGDYQALKPLLRKSVLADSGISQVWLMGSFLNHPQFVSFLKDECQLASELHLIDASSDEQLFSQSIMGLDIRHEMILEADFIREEAERKRKEAEAKKASIAAELKMKDERDQLLQEIKDTCKNPSKRDQYEETFVAKGASLGIPDLVIKWNITEALSRVELVQEGEEVGLEIAAQEAAKPVPPAPVAPEVKPTASNENGNKEEAAKEKPAPKVATPEPVAETRPAPQPEPVFATASATQVAVVEAVATKEAPKPSRKRDQVSVDDIFVWKGDLPDPFFITRKATFHQDSDVKVVRMLSSEFTANGEAVGNFRKVYDKELAYFGDVSEISEAKEGMYYYRKYMERQTLQEYGERNGLANKKNIEELSSADLKFILMLLKEVQELPVSHGNLTAENILVLNKRRWNLSKEMEIKFVEFAPNDVSEEQSLEQTHKALGKVIGEAVYKDFKEKFQL